MCRFLQVRQEPAGESHQTGGPGNQIGLYRLYGVSADSGRGQWPLPADNLKHQDAMDCIFAKRCRITLKKANQRSAETTPGGVS